MKNSPWQLFLLHQTLQLALCIGAGSDLASAKPRWWSVIHHFRELISTASVQWPWALYLCVTARPWKPIHEAPDEQFLCWRCFQRQFGTQLWVLQQRTDDFYTLGASALRSRAVSLCSLTLCGWAVVAPRRFHFTITALIVNWGSTSRANIWGTDVESGHSTVCLWRLHGGVLNFIPISSK